MADLPDTENIGVISHAVAWQITKQAMPDLSRMNSMADRAKEITNTYLIIYKAITSQTPYGEKKE